MQLGLPRDLNAGTGTYGRIYEIFGGYSNMMIVSMILLGLSTYFLQKFDRFILCIASGFYSSMIVFKVCEYDFLFRKVFSLNSELNPIYFMKYAFVYSFILCYLLTIKSEIFTLSKEGN